jgi:hypothetical protein
MTERNPGIRVDGGKQRDLNNDRVAISMGGQRSSDPRPHRVAFRRELPQRLR